MRVRKWEKLSSKKIAKCKIFSVEKIAFKREGDGRSGDFFTIDSDDWVQSAAIVAPEFRPKKYADEECAILVNQFRFAKEKFSWEFPGGVMEKGEKPVKAAARELLEETGFAGTRGKIIAKISPNPAIQTNDAYLVVFENCKKVADVNWDANEEMEMKILPLRMLYDMVGTKIYHSVAINAVCLLEKYLAKKNLKKQKILRKK